MYPRFTLFGAAIESYRFFFVGGWLTALLLSFLHFRKRGIPGDKGMLILWFGSLAALVGARLFHFLLHTHTYLADPSLLLSLDLHGQAVIGGIIGGFLGILALCRFLRISHWSILDLLAPYVGLGIAIGRIGCLLGGCCFGKETDLPIGITFPRYSNPHRYQLLEHPFRMFEVHPVYPTQIFEMIAGLSIFFLSLCILKGPRQDGAVSLSAILTYILFRLLDHWLRAPAQSYSIPQWGYALIYLFLIAWAGGLLVRLRSIRPQPSE